MPRKRRRGSGRKPARRAASRSKKRATRRKSRKVASDVIDPSGWRKLVKLDPEKLRFVYKRKGRRKVVEIRTTKGETILTAPSRPGMAREVKARLRLAGGKPRVGDVRRVRLYAGEGWKLLRHVPTHGDMTFWERTVYQSRQGVPIGQRPGSVTRWWGKRGVSTTGKELWKAFEHIQPMRWERVAEQVPDWFRKRKGTVGVVLKVMDADGNQHDVRTGNAWRLESMTDPRRGHLFLSEMLASALSQAGRRFGYGGATLVLSVGLQLAVRQPGAPTTVRMYRGKLGPAGEVLEPEKYEDVTLPALSGVEEEEDDDSFEYGALAEGE